MGGPPPVAAPPAVETPVEVDEAGRAYVVRSIPKSAAVRLPDGTVRMLGGVRIDVVREDDRAWWYKAYRPPPHAPAPPVPTADDRPPAAPVEPPASARLRLVSFGGGLPTAGQWRDGFAIADLDGDGHPDVVHGPPRKGTRRPVVFLGDGRGGWRPWTAARFPPLPYDYGDARVADFDGDGVPDVAFAMHLRGVVALRHDGAGRFVEMRRGLDLAIPGESPGFSSRALAVADVDGDGRPDLIALGDGPRLARTRGEGAAAAFGAVVYQRRGDGTWARRPERAAPGLFGDSLAVADFDRDGRLDLATASGVLGRQDLVQLARPDGGWEALTLEALRPRAYVRAVAAGDLDRDGRTDLAVAYAAAEGAHWRSGIDVLYDDGTPGWRRAPLVERPGADTASAITIGDVDGDGRLDVVALGGTGETFILLATAAGSFTREPGPPPFGPGCRGSHVELADLDADTHLDLVASFAREPEQGTGTRPCPSGGGIAAWKLTPRDGRPAR